jgi:hypothetical protein
MEHIQPSYTVSLFSSVFKSKQNYFFVEKNVGNGKICSKPWLEESQQ